MSEQRGDALYLAVLRVLGGRLAIAKDLLNDNVNDSWEVGDRAVAVLPSGKRVAQVTLTKGKVGAAVGNERDFLDWVREFHPSEIQTIEQVNPAFKARILKAAAQTGEDYPGVDLRMGRPSPMVKLDADADALIEEAWQSGELHELVGSLLRRAVGPAEGDGAP